MVNDVAETYDPHEFYCPECDTKFHPDDELEEYPALEFECCVCGNQFTVYYYMLRN